MYYKMVEWSLSIKDDICIKWGVCNNVKHAIYFCKKNGNFEI